MSVRTGHCPHAADEPTLTATEGAEVAARKGVISALRSDPHPRTFSNARRGTAA